jgi:23S rRNA (uracil1939-C5)-methyltransferase
MHYDAQLKEKQRRVQEVFPGQTLRPIIPAVSPFRYRNKMEFTFSENRAGMRYLGLMIAQAEPYVYNTEECHLCNTWFTEVLANVRTWWEASGLKAYNPPRDEGTLRYITLREAIRTQQKMVILNISGNPDHAPTRPNLDALVQAVQQTAPDCSIFLRIHQTKKGKPTQFFEMHLAGPDHIVEELHLSGGPLSFKISPISFFQPNTLQAERLYDEALSLIAPLNPTRVFDLYCGTGTLGMASARIAKEVVGIELSPEAVLDAEENLKRNQLSNCTFIQGDVGKVLTQLTTEKGFERPDVVIVDPPRAGLDPLALQHLKNLLPRAILYISCNPLTQAENIQHLLSVGYQLQVLQPVDQFPHTYHIENIALLVR